jgi:tetratricopeptide (TPR) repeat protein
VPAISHAFNALTLISLHVREELSEHERKSSVVAVEEKRLGKSKRCVHTCAALGIQEEVPKVQQSAFQDPATPKTSLKVARAIHKTMPDWGGSADKAQGLYAQALALLALPSATTEDVDAASALLRNALFLSPDDKRLYDARATAALRCADLRTAVCNLRLAVRLDDSDTHLRKRLAQVLHNQGRIWMHMQHSTEVSAYGQYQLLSDLRARLNTSL